MKFFISKSVRRREIIIIVTTLFVGSWLTRIIYSNRIIHGNAPIIPPSQTVPSISSEIVTTTSSTTSSSVTKKQIGGSNTSNVPSNKVIFHIGPHKTGSTAIQSSLANKEYKGSLMRDNYIQLFDGDSFDSKKVMEGCFRGSCPKKISRQVEEAKKSNNNLLLSIEQFDYYRPIDRMKKFFRGFGSIQIILVYRRFFDWLLSWYSMCHTAYWGRYDGGYRNGATNFVSFLETMGAKGFFEYGRYIVQPVEDYKKHFNVTIVDYHDQSGDVVENLFCTPLLNATNTCNMKRAMGSANVGYSRISAKDLLLYDEIAMAAYGTGLLNVSRPVAQIHLREYHESHLNQTVSTLPMICPSEENLNEILQLSLQAEADFSPHPISKDELKEQFEKMKLKGSFCAVNTTMIIENAKWREAFAEINAKSDKYKW